MSQMISTPTSPSNFQSIFNTALKGYEKRTKKGLLVIAIDYLGISPLRTAEHIIHHCPRYLQDRIDTGILRFAVPPTPPLYPFTALLSEKRGVGKLLAFFDQTRALSKPESGPPIPVPPEPD
ncbi:hypothetical protein H4582DRAFT_2078185 [Lactarius indigo]|nr:hypothetical protein H4582DRAFT_2078185 [Lactarius indigo]